MYSKFQPYILLFNFSDKYALRKCKYSYYCTLVSSTNTTDSRYITEIVFEGTLEHHNPNTLYLSNIK